MQEDGKLNLSICSQPNEEIRAPNALHDVKAMKIFCRELFESFMFKDNVLNYVKRENVFHIS